MTAQINIQSKSSPLKLSCEQVHREWMMLITKPWVEALRDSGPVATSRVTTWNRYGRWAATSSELLKDSMSM